jgi:hypothetical protein
MDSRQIAAITHSRRRARVEQDLAIEHNRLALAVPEERAAFESLVRAYLGRDNQIYCVACERFSGLKPSIVFHVSPTAKCSHCGEETGGDK